MPAIDRLIQLFAKIAGVLVLVAPIISVLRQARRPKGRSSGSGAASRTWMGTLLITIGFISMGIWLWQPISFFQSSPSLNLLFSGIGALLYFPAVSIYLWALATMRSQFGVSTLLGAELYTQHELVSNGPFAIIRHPMYASVLLAAIGAFLIFKTWAMAVFLPMSLVVLARANREEKLLAEEFGEAWKTYAVRVPKWFPRLTTKGRG